MSVPCPELGFELRFRVVPGLTSQAIDAILDEFIVAIEKRGLTAGGGGDQAWSHVVSGNGSQATEADREAMLAWARTHPLLRDAVAGPLVDVNDPES